jgi:hypothetical protein
MTMSAQSVPLGQLLSLLDRAMVAVSVARVANRMISVRFSDLN